MSRVRNPARSVLTTTGAGMVVLVLLAAPGSATNATRAAATPSPDRTTSRPVAARVPPSPAGTSPVATTPATTPVSANGADAAPPAPITLAFGGDVHFEAHLAPLLTNGKLAALRPYLATADLAMVNLETAITSRGQEQPKEFHFRTTPQSLRALDAAGVDVVTMANNHAVDYGPVGLSDSLAARRASPIKVVGIGQDAADAYGATVVPVKGRRVAVLAASDLLDWTLQHFEATAHGPGIAGTRPSAEPLLAAVRAARQQADVVVVYLHWGTERMSCPEDAQRSLAQRLADAGADVVIGSHPHVTQGAGYLGQTYVAYSMGNFVWYAPGSQATASSGVLTLTVQGRRVTASRWTPLRISGTDGVPRAPSTATAARMLADWQGSRSCTGLTATPR